MWAVPTIISAMALEMTSTTYRVKGEGSNTPSQPPAEHVKTELTAKDHLVPEECRASFYLSPYDMPTVNQHPHCQPTPPLSTNTPTINQHPHHQPTPPPSTNTTTVNQHPHRQPTPPPSTNTPTVNQHPHRQPTPPPSTNTPTVNQHPHRQPTPPPSLTLLHPTVTPSLLTPHPTSPHLTHHSTPPHPTPCQCSPHPPHPPLGCGVEPGPHTPWPAVVYALKVKYNSIINAYTVHNVTRLNQTESLCVWGGGGGSC